MAWKRKNRSGRSPGTREKGGRRLLSRLLLACVIAAAVALGGLVAVALLLTPDCADEGCPTLETIQDYSPPEPPHVYDRYGDLVGQLPGPQRLVVSLDDVSPLVREGFVAVEDRRFREHGGVDPLGVLRAAVRNVTAGKVEEGASTITMQLVRNVFGADVRAYNRWRRKLTEVRMALALEDRLSKDEILELYLNQIYLGGGAWGVETAARYFFGRSAGDLTPAQAALLIGLAKSPEGYNPRTHPERALERRSVVLSVMLREGILTAAQAETARNEELMLVARPEGRRIGAYYLAAVDRQVRETFPDPRTREGIRVHTGYDPALQRAAVTALRGRIREIEEGAVGPYPHPVAPEDMDVAPVADGPSPYLQGMVVALDARRGTVLALVGGRDFGHSEFDRALQAERQPGSAIKPILYSAALGLNLTLMDEIETGPVEIQLAGQEPWRPADQGDGEPMTVREALRLSSNTAAVRVGQYVGVETLIAQSRRLGITTPMPPYPSIFLGSAEVRPVELVAAYAAFGNGGRRVTPHLVTRIEDPEGMIVWLPEDLEPRSAIPPGVAFLTLDALRDVVETGTGWRVREEGFTGAAAGKTGTTDEGKDTWFIGLTPEVVAGVWMGFDNPRPIVEAASGGRLVAPVWARMMREGYRPIGGFGAADAATWLPPPDVVSVLIDTQTGYVAGPDCPEEAVRSEYFLVATAPAIQCPVHRGGILGGVITGLKRILGVGGG